MPSAWLTYSWKDNERGDVDFIVQELTRAGLQMKLDRMTLPVGKRLWEQIGHFITDPAECDAWIFFATQNSLVSQPCREELAYALERALRSRGDEFPVIALLQSHGQADLLPPAIRTRLYVAITEDDWKDRIVDSVTGRARTRTAAEITPYSVEFHRPPSGFQLCLEVRPRGGVWHPFIACVRLAEKDLAGLVVRDGARGFVPSPDAGYIGGGHGPSKDGQWHIETGYQAATPTHSYFLFLRKAPSAIVVGQDGAEDRQFQISLQGTAICANQPG